MKAKGLRIRYFDGKYALCDGKPPVGIAPVSGEIYMGNIFAWYNSCAEAKKALSLIDTLYGFNRYETEKGEKTPIMKFKFCLVQRPEYKLGFKGYDGAVFTAPDEQKAWDIFLSCDGEFKCPNSYDYTIENLGFAYLFNGNIEQWEQAVKSGEVE